jgi:hypothetical protein
MHWLAVVVCTSPLLSRRLTLQTSCTLFAGKRADEPGLRNAILGLKAEGHEVSAPRMGGKKALRKYAARLRRLLGQKSNCSLLPSFSGRPTGCCCHSRPLRCALNTTSPFLVFYYLTRPTS